MELSFGPFVLVPGGAGFIGSHLCDRLMERGHCVLAFDDLSTGTRGNLQHLQGLGTRGHTHHLRALFGEQSLQVFARVVLVVHGENGDAGQRLVMLLRHGRCRQPGCGVPRQLHAKRGALAAAADAAGRYHYEKGSPVESLRTSMAISTRNESSGANAFTLTRMLVPTLQMPITERFAAINEIIGIAREQAKVASLDTLATMSALLPTTVLTRIARTQSQTVDFATSNVRGAGVPLYIGGAMVLAAMLVVELTPRRRVEAEVTHIAV